MYSLVTHVMSHHLCIWKRVDYTFLCLSCGIACAVFQKDVVARRHTSQRNPPRQLVGVVCARGELAANWQVTKFGRTMQEKVLIPNVNDFQHVHASVRLCKVSSVLNAAGYLGFNQSTLHSTVWMFAFCVKPMKLWPPTVHAMTLKYRFQSDCYSVRVK